MPIRSIVVLSHTQIAFLDLLGKTDDILGVNASNYLPHPVLQEKIRQDKVSDVGDGPQLNHELVLAINPDLVMAVGFSSLGLKDYQPVIAAGIPVVINSDWLENTPLGRSEWLKFMALFYNEEQQAEEKFQKIEQNYQRIKNIARKAPSQPTVFNGLPYKDTWYVAAGESYLAWLIKDAQAQYLWSDHLGTGSLPLDFEAVYAKAYRADYWINLDSD
ncbi:MAG: ABC transporter substrate-binding protein [Bacteroidia bacterium]|nr:ABC transporter substrate-binding protein [Bacteroidia bacterium]